MFRIIGGINCWDPDKDSETGGLSSITIRMEYLFTFQYWYWYCFINFYFLAVLGVVGWGRKSYFGLAEIVSFFRRSFSHLNQIWFKCETLLLFFLIIFYYISFDQQSSANVLQNRCFPAKLAKFLRTPFFKEDLRWLLLYMLYTHDVTCNLSRWNKGYNDIYKKDQ